MTDIETAPDNRFAVTQNDLDVVVRVARAAQEAWPLYAEAKGIACADKHQFVGIDEEGARFDYDDIRCGHFMGTESEYMPLTYLFDCAALLAEARAARLERERREREEQARQQAAHREALERIAAQRKAADHATYERIAAQIANGTYVPPIEA